MLTKRTVLRAFAAAGMLLVAALPAAAEKIVGTDIIGRKVEVEAPVRKIILGREDWYKWRAKQRRQNAAQQGK